MALFDFLKKKKEIEKAKEKQPEKKSEKASAAKKEIKKEAKAPVVEGKLRGVSFEIVKEPHISEKSTILGQANQYVFKVYQRANKQEVKKSVEGIYGVNVLKVRTVKIAPKKRRLGRTEGFKKGYAKAIVTIKEGQKIELF